MAKGPSKSMVNRGALVMGAFVVVCFGALVAFLVYYQIINHNFYQSKAISQQTMNTEISAKRGTIFDRNYKELAVSASVETIFISPAGVKDDEQAKLISKELSKILDVDENSLYEKTKKNNYYEIVKKKVEKDVADKVRAFINENKITCIYLAEDTKRYYPMSNLASHVIGFTGTDNNGLDGIEKKYDDYLQGKPGKIITAKNAKGTAMAVEYETYIDAQDGNDVVLTIDSTIQQYLEKHMEAARADNKAESVAGIVMDVKSGEILAMTSKPDYDLNSPIEITDENTKEILSKYTGDELKKQTTYYRNKIWRNKNIVDTYEPGSTFKILTTSMALEENVVNENSRFDCPGYKIVSGTRISCWKSGGHGSQNLYESVQHSCNPAFMTIAEKVGNKNFIKYVKAFGVTDKTGIDLIGEATGIFHKEENFNTVELATSSFGQTFKVTPISMLTSVCAVANGGNLITPHVVKQISKTDANGNTKIVKNFSSSVKRQVISKETSKKVCEILESVVAVGSGKNAYVSGYRIAGKTGTSEKIDSVDKKGRIASFIGFAPADDPQVAVLVMIDEPSAGEVFGGIIAAPVAGDILADILPYMGITPQYTEEELMTLDTTVPQVIDLSSQEAQKIISQKGLKYKIVGGEGKVENQMPKAGEGIPKSGTVIIYTNGKTPYSQIIVPDLTNMSIGEAQRILLQEGLNIKIVGNERTKETARIVSQSPAAGTKVESGSVITIRHKNYDGVED